MNAVAAVKSLVSRVFGKYRGGPVMPEGMKQCRRCRKFFTNLYAHEECARCNRDYWDEIQEISDVLSPREQGSYDDFIV